MLYCFNVYRICVPLLRERHDDIPPLVSHFIFRVAPVSQYVRPPDVLEHALELLQS